MNELAGIIEEEIRRDGPMGFDRFMELALYHPQLGYYRRKHEKPRTGREGDFFTSVSVGPLFGRLLARQFLEMWEMLGSPATFWILEQGAEDGQLACDILGWCKKEAPAFFAVIRYGIVDEFPGAQREKIDAAGFSTKLNWFDDVPILDGEGVFFSNELIDAFPVRVVLRQNEAWVERCVDSGLTWATRPIIDRELTEAVKVLPTREGYTTEIHLRARQWMEKVGCALKRGYVLTIDYGFPDSIYYEGFRSAGTLTAYQNHRRMDDVLAEPGERDITAHVEFMGLMRAGEKAGLVTLGFLDQQHFFMGVAHDELSEADGPRTGLAKNVRAWQTLTHPSYLGTRFQVLVQGRNAPAKPTGLRFAKSLSS